MAAATAIKGPRPYRDFLTPVLHRRFTNAAIWSAVACYAIGIWQSDFDVLWSWFPFGPTGVRTVLLFITVLMSYVLHISQLHVSESRAPSQFQDFLRHACSFEALHTVFWYLLSAIIFCESYIWSRDADANLNVIDPGRPYERPRLNERPIYLRTLFMILGLQEAAWHLMSDKSRIGAPANKIDAQTGEPIRKSRRSMLKESLVPLIVEASTRMLIISVVAPLLYATFLRHTAWHWNLVVAKKVFTLPKASKPSRMPPFLGDLILRFYVEGALLVFLWGFSSTAFRIFLAEPPMKKGLPLTSDSKDPNESLLQGLKAKKEALRTFAFWELDIIAHSSPLRREMIYKDIDRAGGSAWSQIVVICLGELHAISKRIQDFRSPPKPAADPIQLVPAKDLPPLGSSAKRENVLEKPLAGPWMQSQVSSFAKAHGESPGAVDPITPRARKMLEMGTDALISKETQQALSQSFLGKYVQSYLMEFLKTPIGWPFRQTFAKRSSSIALGGAGSLSNVSIIVDATRSLAKLATSSLKEDRYGRVSKDVANIIRTYVLTIQAVEEFVRTLDVHWTDVTFDRRKIANSTATSSNVFGAGEIEAGRKVPAIDEVLTGLQESLASLIRDFSEFREELGLKTAELRRAKEVVGNAVEMSGKVR